MLLEDGGLLGQRQRTMQNLQQCSCLRTSGISTLSLIPRTPAPSGDQKRSDNTSTCSGMCYRWDSEPGEPTHFLLGNTHACPLLWMEALFSKAVHKTHLPQGSPRAESSQCRSTGGLRRVDPQQYMFLFDRILFHLVMDIWLCSSVA